MLCQKLRLVMHIKFSSIKENHPAVLNCKPLQLFLRVFVAGHTVAMATYCVTKMIITCSPTIGKFFYTMIAASSDKTD